MHKLSSQPPVTLIRFDMGLEQAFDPNTIDVLAFHGAPGAPAVDINDVFEDPILNSFDAGSLQQGMYT